MEQASEPKKQETKKEEPKEFIVVLATADGMTKIVVPSDFRGSWRLFCANLPDPEAPSLKDYWRWKNSLRLTHHVYK